MQIESEVYYRYEDVRYAPPADECGERYGIGDLKVELRKFDVKKHTPKGTVINYYNQRKFILREANKHFACPTIEEAKASFIARKKRQASIHRARYEQALEAIEKIEKKGLFSETN